jgi:IS30 family transposase
MERRYKQLTLEERCTIARLHEDGQSMRQIASIMGRAASSIAREIKRNSGSQIGYRPGYAEQQTLSRRWRGSRLERNASLRDYVLGRMAQGYSPEQVAGRLAIEYGKTVISHESIYRFIDAQIRRTKDYAWHHYLPRAKSKRGWRGRKGGSSIQNIRDRVPIAVRPPEVQTRQQFGHWEADLMMFSNRKNNLLVLQERSSRFVMLTLQPDKKSQRVIDNQLQCFAILPKHARRSLTQDNGTEFSLHHKLQHIGMQTYFCNPHRPWQKGGIENMNGRLRRYLPLRTDISSLCDENIAMLAHKINHIPRKCLDYKTPAEVFFNHLLHFKCESTSPPARE